MALWHCHLFASTKVRNYLERYAKVWFFGLTIYNIIYIRELVADIFLCRKYYKFFNKFYSFYTFFSKSISTRPTSIKVTLAGYVLQEKFCYT